MKPAKLHWHSNLCFFVFLLLILASAAFAGLAPSSSSFVEESINPDFSKSPNALPAPTGESTLNIYCREPGEACGSCEKKLQNDIDGLINSVSSSNNGTNRDSKVQLKPGTTLESFLAQAIDVMKKNNIDAQTGQLIKPNEVNMLVIGNSQSVQSTKPGFPRIAIRSPNSEFWMTINTDPSSASFNRIEIMRWNGLSAKYEFQEIVFPSESETNAISSTAAYFDPKPQSCVRCHGDGVIDSNGHQGLRPIWDSYRAWAGVVPPRDDLLETDPPPTAQNGHSTKSAKRRDFDPYARSYFRFLDKVADAKNGTSQDPAAARLALLPIPYRADNKSLNPTAQVEALKTELSDVGFLRIPHFPENKFSLANQNVQSAPYSGSSQHAFDQMMSQQSCRIANDMWNHPKISAFKYAVTDLIACSPYDDSIDFDQLKQLIPNETLERINDYWRNDPAIGKMIAANPKLSPFEAIKKIVSENHNVANTDKINRAQQLIRGEMGLERSSELASVPRVESVRRTKLNKDVLNSAMQVTRETFAKSYDVNRAATHFSTNVRTPQYERDNRRYVVATDPGGVAGVAGAPESDTNKLAALTFLLKPLGMNPGRWSMTQGANPAEPNWAFSDQFKKMMQQQNWIRHLATGNLEKNINCTNMRSKSQEAFTPASVEAVPRPRTQESLNPAFASACQKLLINGVPDNMLLMGEAVTFQSCAQCHADEGFPVFDVSDDSFLDNSSVALDKRKTQLMALKEYLNKKSNKQNRTTAQSVNQYELAIARVTGDKTMNTAIYARQRSLMPPSSSQIESTKWAVQLSPEQSHDFYRPAITSFLTKLTEAPSVDAYMSYSVTCRELYGEEFVSKENKGAGH